MGVMARSVYIETSVVSYYVASTSGNSVIAGHQEATQNLWPELQTQYETFISALVLEEARRGDPLQSEKRMEALKPFAILDIDEQSIQVAKALVHNNAIPAEHYADAVHVAVAAVNGMDVLLTWNFSHLNNPFTRMCIRETVEKAGYGCPEICSPDELLGENL